MKSFDMFIATYRVAYDLQKTLTTFPHIPPVYITKNTPPTQRPAAYAHLNAADLQAYAILDGYRQTILTTLRRLDAKALAYLLDAMTKREITADEYAIYAAQLAKLTGVQQ